MLRLTLVRHAKSSWKDARLFDADRPLSSRGKRAADALCTRLAEEFATGAEAPDLVICSPARRTYDTLARLAPAFGPSTRLIYDPALYMADRWRIFARLRAVPRGVRHAMIVGHNPGLEDAATLLADPASSDRAALRRLAAKFPTAARATFEVDSASWRQLAAARARLIGFETPSDFGAG